MSISPPLRACDIIFPSASHSIQTTLTELDRSHLSIANRLRSIHADSDFVLEVAGAYQLPLVANERCGSWYIPPEKKSASAYFKSTDGHFGQWSFSLRRLNIQVLDLVGNNGGCIIVDSTRRGKSMPDALSKTIPIWCTVMNRLLFDHLDQCHGLTTPTDVVSVSEHSQIEARLASFVVEARTLDLDWSAFRAKLHAKPFEVIWHRPGDSLPKRRIQSEDTNVIVLCTASNRTGPGSSTISEYVQGAADDSESWARGLDPATFWMHREQLLQQSDGGLPDLIKALIDTRAPNQALRLATEVSDMPIILISSNAAVETLFKEYNFVLSCSTDPNTKLQQEMEDRYIHLQCSTGKLGSRRLRSELEKVRALCRHPEGLRKVLVTCHTGRDASVGVALAMMCLCSSNRSSLDRDTGAIPGNISKLFIKQVLGRIMVSMPDAAPSRATLQSVNAFLMGGG